VQNEAVLQIDDDDQNQDRNVNRAEKQIHGIGNQGGQQCKDGHRDKLHRNVTALQDGSALRTTPALQQTSQRQPMARLVRVTTLRAVRHGRLPASREVVRQGIDDGAGNQAGKREHEIECHTPHYSEDPANGKPYHWGVSTSLRYHRP
jgi:hypothetical protein